MTGALRHYRVATSIALNRRGLVVRWNCALSDGDYGGWRIKVWLLDTWLGRRWVLVFDRWGSSSPRLRRCPVLPLFLFRSRRGRCWVVHQPFRRVLAVVEFQLRPARHRVSVDAVSCQSSATSPCMVVPAVVSKQRWCLLSVNPVCPFSSGGILFCAGSVTSSSDCSVLWIVDYYPCV